MQITDQVKRKCSIELREIGAKTGCQYFLGVRKAQLAATDGGESCKPEGLRAGSAQQHLAGRLDTLVPSTACRLFRATFALQSGKVGDFFSG